MAAAARALVVRGPVAEAARALAAEVGVEAAGVAAVMKVVGAGALGCCPARSEDTMAAGGSAAGVAWAEGVTAAAARAGRGRWAV